MRLFTGVPRNRIPLRRARLGVSLWLWNKLQSMSEVWGTSFGWWEWRWMNQHLCLGITSPFYATPQCRSLHWRRNQTLSHLTLYVKALHVMNGGQRMWILMKMWLTCSPNHWVVQSEPSLFGWFYNMSFLRKKSRGHGRRLSRSCSPQELELPTHFLYFNTHGVLLRVLRVQSELELWASILLDFFIFLFFWILEGIEQSKAVVSRVEQSRIGLRGVFQCCVTCEWRLQVKRTD